VRRIQWQDRAGIERDIGVDYVGERLHGRTKAPGVADDEANMFAFGIKHRECHGIIMGKKTDIRAQMGPKSLAKGCAELSHSGYILC
jgi:hypothetical protein